MPTNPSFHIPIFPVPQLFEDSCFISALETCLIYDSRSSFKDGLFAYENTPDFDKWVYDKLNNAALTKKGKIRNYSSTENGKGIVPINHLTLQKCFPPVGASNRKRKIYDWVEKFTRFELTEPKKLRTLSLGDLEKLLLDNGPIIITNNAPWSYNTEGGEDFNITMGREVYSFSRGYAKSTINMGGRVSPFQYLEDELGHAATIVGFFGEGTPEYLIINDSHNNNKTFQINFENVKVEDYLDYSADSIFVVHWDNFRNSNFEYISTNWKNRAYWAHNFEIWLRIFECFYPR